MHFLVHFLVRGSTRTRYLLWHHRIPKSNILSSNTKAKQKIHYLLRRKATLTVPACLRERRKTSSLFARQLSNERLSPYENAKFVTNFPMSFYLNSEKNSNNKNISRKHVLSRNALHGIDPLEIMRSNAKLNFIIEEGIRKYNLQRKYRRGHRTINLSTENFDENSPECLQCFSKNSYRRSNEDIQYQSNLFNKITPSTKCEVEYGSYNHIKTQPLGTISRSNFKKANNVVKLLQQSKLYTHQGGVTSFTGIRFSLSTSANTETSSVNDERRILSHNPSLQAERSEKVVRLALLGNLAITAAKFAAYISSGSSAMLSEAIHSVVDSGNQALLLVGLRTATSQPDRQHQYGYGKSVYFWSLVSAVGTFWLGAGISMKNAISDLIHPSVEVDHISYDVWGVLGISFGIDGYVLYQTIHTLQKSKPSGISLFEYIRRLRDPTTLAVLLEDSGACMGVVFAIAGIGLTQYTLNPIFDAAGAVGVSTLLAGMGLALARVNERYLLGQSVDPEYLTGIKEILLARPGIDSVQSVQSQWIGPYTFAYKAEVDFDGTYIAAKLMNRYEDEFLGSPKLKDELPVLLAFYAEDVVRTLEREVRDVERVIRSKYPEAQFIDIEPASKDTTTFAIDSHREKMLRELEHITLNQLIIALANSVVEEKKEQGVLSSLSAQTGNDTTFDRQNMLQNNTESGVYNIHNENSGQDPNLGVPTYPPSEHNYDNYVNTIMQDRKEDTVEDSEMESENTILKDKQN